MSDDDSGLCDKHDEQVHTSSNTRITDLKAVLPDFMMKNYPGIENEAAVMKIA
jgi:hypothetical protein